MKNFAQRIWRWIVFICKVYIIAVPATVLICQIVGKPVPMYKPDTYYNYLEGGYFACFVALLLNAILAFYSRNKSEFSNALIFIVLAVISMIFFVSYHFFSPPILK